MLGDLLRTASKNGRGAPATATRVGRTPPLLLGICVLLSAVLLPISAAGSSTIGGDKAQVAALEQKIDSEGSQVQNLVSQYDAVEGRLVKIDLAIASSRGELDKDQLADKHASSKLRSEAIDSYVNATAANGSGIATFINSSNASALPARNVYLNFASGNLDQALTNLERDESATTATQTKLKTEETQTQATLTALASSKSAAQGAIDEEQSILSGVNSNLLTLVNEANQRRQAEQEKQDEEEEALAAAAAQHVSSSTAAAPAAAATPGNYANPLRGIRGLSPERIDQGVDYGGSGPIYALGDGVIISTVCSGWPGGTFISYRLTDGPAAGLVVYAAEDIEPMVQVGQSVTPSTVIGEVYEGYTGIETGWSDASGDGTTMAADNDQYSGGNSTAFGANFSRLLSSLGAPGGILQNNPPTGSLPAGWPNW